jgi:hypothetical protein
MSEKSAKKWLRHPCGTEVVVKAEDAEAMAESITRANVLAGKKKFKVDVLDAPTYTGGEKGVDPVSKPMSRTERMAAAIAKSIVTAAPAPSGKGK